MRVSAASLCDTWTIGWCWPHAVEIADGHSSGESGDGKIASAAAPGQDDHWTDRTRFDFLVHRFSAVGLAVGRQTIERRVARMLQPDEQGAASSLSGPTARFGALGAGMTLRHEVVVIIRNVSLQDLIPSKSSFTGRDIPAMSIENIGEVII
jgi:hypothetical protein